jgi:hypothetical protein
VIWGVHSSSIRLCSSSISISSARRSLSDFFRFDLDLVADLDDRDLGLEVDDSPDAEEVDDFRVGGWFFRDVNDRRFSVTGAVFSGGISLPIPV